MRIEYLGTGAAEGIPSPFCNCDVCKKSRVKGGKNIKRRSCSLINSDTLIDLSPDVFSASVCFNTELYKVKNILFTHSHADHLDAFSLMLRCRNGASLIPYLTEEENFVSVYGNEKVKKRIYEAFASQPHANRKRLVFHEIHANEQFNVGELKILPVLANHIIGEECFIYVIQQEEKVILYGNDTGTLSEQSIRVLCNYPSRFSLVSLDCSRGILQGDAHMGINEVLALIDSLKNANRIDDKTMIYLNHFSHVCGLLPEEFELFIYQYGLKLSYDGLSLVL